MSKSSLERKKALEQFILDANELHQEINSDFENHRPPSAGLIQSTVDKWEDYKKKILPVLNAMYDSDFQQSEFLAAKNNSAVYRQGNVHLQNILKDIEAKLQYLRKIHGDEKGGLTLPLSDPKNENAKEGKSTSWYIAIFGVFATILIGLGFWYFNLNGNRQDLEENPNANIENSPNSFTIVGNNNTINKLDLPKPKIEIQPFEIRPNPELGFESVYIIKIISDYTIPNFSLKIKLPPTVNEMWLSKGWMYTMTEDYSAQYIDGYASFNIPNAGGDYYLVFSNKNEVNLSKDDIVY
ncbi:hypothetical protein K8942_01990 [Candidatus Peribacteria bacterium]|nr:MAG: hypothetical protein K8942_01990 [Candidatus Peribacteria bacterium]